LAGQNLKGEKMEVSKITLTVHKDPKELLMRNMDLTLLFDNKEEHTYHRKAEHNLVILQFIQFLDKLDDAVERFEKKILTLKNEGRTENARDEEDRKSQATSSTDSDSKGSSQEGEDSLAKETQPH